MSRTRLFCVASLAAIAAMTSAASAERAAPDDTTDASECQPSGECFYLSQRPPRAGQIFTAFVLVRSDEARSRYESIKKGCVGAIFPKRPGPPLRSIVATLTTLPEDAAVPAVEILMFKIPKRVAPGVSAAGKRFGFACSSTSVQLFPDGLRAVGFADGALVPYWPILP
jgi:hypothetical protein